jgi:hypothetical protein
MSTFSPVRHQESWTFDITRDEEDTWPDCPVPHRTVPATFRPEAVRVELTRGTRFPYLTVSGWQIKSDGTPGRQEVTVRYYDIGKLGDTSWLAEAVDQHRRLLNLGPGATDVDWLAEAADQHRRLLNPGPGATDVDWT